MKYNCIMFRLACGLFLTGLIGLSGCGSDTKEFAPVSGVVTLDGQPLPGAHVSFQPYGKDGNPGPGSVGIADDAGRFELTSARRDDGALLGKHAVVISAPADHPPLPTNSVDFEVPADGTDAANFDLTSK